VIINGYQFAPPECPSSCSEIGHFRLDWCKFAIGSIIQRNPIAEAPTTSG
jgi:hypothetical protein